MTRLWETGPRLPDDPGRYIPIAIQREVFARDADTCQYCGRVGDTLDHVWPWSQGGTHHVRNLVASCQQCNSIAGERVFTEFLKKKAYILQRRIDLYGEGYEL